MCMHACMLLAGPCTMLLLLEGPLPHATVTSRCLHQATVTRWATAPTNRLVCRATVTSRPLHSAIVTCRGPRVIVARYRYGPSSKSSMGQGLTDSSGVSSPKCSGSVAQEARAGKSRYYSILQSPSLPSIPLRGRREDPLS